MASEIDDKLGYLTKGCVDVVPAEQLGDKLKRSAETGEPLVIKVGFDPSAPDLHLGHTVVIRKMRHFQQLGHRVIFLIGDFTGLIGDPTGKKSTRPQLTPEEVEAWVKREPIAPYRKLLIEQEILTEAEADEIEANVLAELDAAVEFARQSPLPEPESALQDLWA